MIKTKTYKKFNGDSASVTFELVKNSTFWSILRIATNGLSAQNQWGGYTCVHTGSPAYITRKWKDIA